MDIIKLIKTRRSIRRYRDEPVADELLEKILDAGRWAPSGLNNQPWRFAVIKDPVIKEEVSRLTRYEKIIKGARALIAVFLDNAESYHRTKDIQAVGACIQNMLLTTHSLGLGAVWLGEIIKSNEEIKGILGLGRDLELMAVLALGYPDGMPVSSERKELRDLIVFRR